MARKTPAYVRNAIKALKKLTGGSGAIVDAELSHLKITKEQQP